MIVGFTGTRRGLTRDQELGLRAQLGLLAHKGATTFVHGCEPHSDRTAAQIAHGLGLFVIGHPGPGSTGTDFDDDTKEPRPYLDRNDVIVASCDVLVACPEGEEILRSGTWATIRRARRTGTPIVLVWPDGDFTEEGRMPNPEDGP